MTESLLWVEGYRPKTIDECILSKTIKGTLTDLVKDEKVPNLMFTGPSGDRKSTRLNSSHVVISYAVFCLKKKKRNEKNSF